MTLLLRSVSAGYPDLREHQGSLMKLDILGTPTAVCINKLDL